MSKRMVLYVIVVSCLTVICGTAGAQYEGFLEVSGTVSDEYIADFDIGQEEAWHIHQIDDTTYISTGFSTLPSCGRSGKHAMVMKVVGNLFSQPVATEVKYFGDSAFLNDYQGRAIHPIGTSGNFIFVGLTDKNGFDQILLMKLDGNLDTIWTRIYGDSSAQTGAYAIQPTGDGGFVLTGYTRPTGVHDSTDVYVLRIDSNGDALTGWPKTYDIASDIDVGKSIRVYREGNDSGFVVAGFSRVSGQFDMTLFKTDFSGNSISGWPKTYDGIGSGGDFAESVILVKDSSGNNDGYLVSGNSITEGGTTLPRGFVWRIGTEGDTLWTAQTNHYSGAIQLSIVTGAIQRASDQGFYVGTIYRLSGENVTSILLSSLNENGENEWNKNVDGNASDYVYWVQPTAPDNGFVYCGATFSTDFDADSSDVIVGKGRLASSVCGDVDLDGYITIADRTYLQRIVDSSLVPPDYATANVDGSCPANEVTNADVTYLTNYMFYGGPAPQCPWCQ